MKVEDRHVLITGARDVAVTEAIKSGPLQDHTLIAHIFDRNDVSWWIRPAIVVLPEGLALVENEITAHPQATCCLWVARVLAVRQDLRCRREPPGVVGHVQFTTEA